jgi:hypothetical protein
MRHLLTSPKFIIITLAAIALFVIPLTLIEVQSQQNIKQNAESILWVVNDSASTACAPDGSGANIAVTFTNAESPSTSTAMNVVATDQQTSKSVNMGSIKGGTSKTSIIATGKTSLDAGKVTFALTWTDGHSGTDSETASYNAVSKCVALPTPTLTPKPTPTPTTPPGQPTPTICPTLQPVKEVHIVCPNCQLNGQK